MNLTGKKILILISGGIAAYKINSLVRDFVKANAEVQIILTPSAERFVSPLTLSTLSKKPVYSQFFSDNGQWNSHVDIALWADVLLVAPCTANTLAKMVNGLCDNLALATYLSAKCPVFIAPAMDLDMYQHPSTLQNLNKLEKYGHFIIPAEHGELASGLIGQGRMAEPETIFKTITCFLNSKNIEFDNKKFLITAGPTYEAIDPVRFIGNHSSGKMGFALAEEAANRGAKVTLISGPSSLQIEHPNIEVIRVTSAKEMYEKVFCYYDQADVAIASAAVADYAPKEIAKEKIKKNDEVLTLELVKNPDILKNMGQRKNNQILVGFALETQNEEENAQKKLVQKNLDMIVLNSLREPGAGFQKDTNRIKIISRTETIDFPLKSKSEVAIDILNCIAQHLNNNH
ncbi:MAG: bifunctional phosphopantothenoylcysteine decarboxylase/phosphopantothenate--cysteine ligase CoaBC [Bacteroidetes bacterium]|nr:bifunctional phosphopantothenoylcysteine decarboxylase/phosphopantothenate--cysteine ligase CoaBC [Bacteroidota bacterium]